ncbi:MAG: hypothetical protein HEQ37_08305 [Acidovorax sp.]|nr:hypothetical protein [Acidovorax sp.]
MLLMVAKAACGKIKNLKRKKKSFDGALKTVLEFKAQLIAAKSGKQRKTSV